MPDAKARLEEREGAFLRKTYKPEGVSGKIKAHIDAARKEAKNKELPRYAQRSCISVIEWCDIRK